MDSNDSASTGKVAIIVAIIGLLGTLITVVINKWPFNPSEVTVPNNNTVPNTTTNNNTTPNNKNFSENPPIDTNLKGELGKASLIKKRYYLPGDGTKNNNNTIGDFCCTGETATIISKSNYPVGYIYYYDFKGGMNISNTESVASEFGILVSGLSDINNSESNHIKQSIDFRTDELYNGSTKSIQAGSLNFKITILTVSKYSDPKYYEMGSVNSQVDISIVND